MSQRKPAKAADPKRPYHVGVALGLSTGLYAVALGAVTSAQVEHDRAVIEDRRPMQQAIDLLGNGHQRMESRMSGAWDRYEQASGGYDQVTLHLADLEAALQLLSETVAGIEGSAFALPDRLALPAVPLARPAAPAPAAAPAAAAPPVQATTGASGQ